MFTSHPHAFTPHAYAPDAFTPHAYAFTPHAYAWTPHAGVFTVIGLLENIIHHTASTVMKKTI